MESSAYDLGKILTEQFELPNLKDKGKKSALVRYSYDLTDRHRGFGQLLDKKATLRKILETNIALGNLPDHSNIDTSRLVISPKDKLYRILSSELDYESQAMVFFVRDYSGSMDGRPNSTRRSSTGTTRPRICTRPATWAAAPGTLVAPWYDSICSTSSAEST